MAETCAFRPRNLVVRAILSKIREVVGMAGAVEVSSSLLADVGGRITGVVALASGARVDTANAGHFQPPAGGVGH